MKKIILAICLLFSVFCLPAYGGVPHLINYQGRLTDSGGTPLNGSYSLTFRIYDSETSGNLLWEETHSGAVIQKGIFSVLLGSVTALNLPFDKPYFLEIKVGAEVMTPRQRITSAGYAIRAERAEDANNANTVANVGVSTTPAANKILPLDNNAKLPLSVLKVYDSGWFVVSTNQSYIKTHSLGTKKILPVIFASTTSDGSNDVWQVNQWGVIATDNNQVIRGPFLKIENSMSVSINTGNETVWEKYVNGETVDQTSGYMRVLILALE